jgi:DNA-binding beta-propeller fold protein YncE
MRRHLVLVGSSLLVLANATGVAAANGGDDGHHGGPNPLVLATGLDNPRQLNWHQHKLLIAEGGRGGEDCDEATGACRGLTGQISAVDSPFRDRTGLSRTVVDELFSVTTTVPEPATIGSDGVAATGFPQVFLIAEGEPFGDQLVPEGFETDDPEAETQEHLLISVAGQVFRWVDFGALETELNPDGKPELDSNPNAVIVVDPTPEGELGDDEFALVADAGANTVWKVDPDFTTPDENGLPTPEVSVFAAYDATDEAAPEFVPSALDVDAHGNVYVGGVGSFVPGGAQVVRYTIDGEETGRWAGFTAINGLAVDEHGEHVYVSQILEGNVIRVDTENETWTSFDVPFPSGLALGEDAEDPDEDQYRGSSAWGYRDEMDDSDDHGEDGGHHGNRDDAVFVSAYSVFPADADDPATEELEGGQVWRFTFPEHADEQPLPVTPPAVP